ncbi:MAG TPA: hypothetical protein VF368_07540 [Gemmatimonadaceae bacterium]
MPHPDEGLLHAWIDGELDAAEAARVEALVASDPEWAVAAMEARGLLAASARIVTALDHVPANVLQQPANVIPQPATSRRTASRWMWRVAAVVALMAGSAVVLERGTPDFTAPAPAKPPMVEPGLSPEAAGALSAPSAAQATAKAPAADITSTIHNKELDISKQSDSLHDRVASSAPRGERADAAASGSRVAPAPAPPRPAAGGTPMQAQAFAKTTRLRSSCFLRLEPRDSATRVIRLDAVALADSIRLERLTLRGDTLSAVHGSLTAIRVPCPEP